MAFFAMPYRVLFHDTMSYGSHHFLTNFKFQCEVREHFFFTEVIERFSESAAALQDLIPLTQEGYTRNLSPLEAGSQVGLLLSFEEPTRSSVRMCFRVIAADGTPVCCGFQSLVCTSRKTGQVIAAPAPLMTALAPLREKLWSPSFQDRVLAGGTAMKEIFDEDVMRCAAAAIEAGKPAILPDVMVPAATHTTADSSNRPIVLTFPGQGSWDPQLFQQIIHLEPSAASLLLDADKISSRELGVGVCSISQGNGSQLESALRRCRELPQVGAFLTSVFAARHLMASGVNPHLLLGHSFGEIAALAVGGAIDVLSGVELICHRIKAIESLPGPTGGMIAMFCDEKRARSLVKEAAAESLEISIINHADQTVVSGTTEDLRRLTAVLESQQITSVPLKSAYPFHSRILGAAVAPFEEKLKTLRFHSLTIPVYSPLDRGLHVRDPSIAKILPRHFVQHLCFPDALQDAYALGGKVFIECGGGTVLTSLAQRILRDRAGVSFHAVASEDGSTQQLARLAKTFGSERTPSVDTPSSVQSAVEKPVSDVSRIEPEIALADSIAIVSMGCVLPGAADPCALWQNLLSQKIGIVDLAQLDSTLADDFRCDHPVRPDKTYSLLCGRVSHIPAEAAAKYFSPDEFAKLAVIQKLLAATTAQCLSGLKTTLPESKRIHCVFGSTADGSIDYEESLLLSGALEKARSGSLSPLASKDVGNALERAFGRTLTGAGERMPHGSYTSVARRLLGDGVKVLAVDAACASSLYAIDVAIRLLRGRECDLAICGGVFAPAMGNTCLFAQFNGLSSSAIRPLDATADGVVFGEGAALLVLKRLPDALTAGDNIHAVICGIGTSSDGKSPSVMEPRTEGQCLAIRRAAAQRGISPATIQYIDAHATGTPVGDAVEFKSLCATYGPRPDFLPPIRLGSLKALLGHTGWVAGAASVIALCKAFEHRTFPPQPGFSSPNPQFGIERTSFVVDTKPAPWPANRANGEELPRRAGINGFGFGGCDAHLILEEFVPNYHAPLNTALSSSRPALQPSVRAESLSKGVVEDQRIAIVGFSSLLPSSRETEATGKSLQFTAEELRLPGRVRILPDVADHLDRGQNLAVRAANEILSSLPESWASLRAETGVVLGFVGKTRRGLDASLRIYADRIQRRLAEIRSSFALDDSQFDATCEAMLAAIRRIPPSGPYTLQGIMPNVAAGRIANVFHLGGPNMVLDSEQTSLFEAIAEAARLLRFQACQLVLAGGISSCAGRDIDRIVQSVGDPDTRRVGEAAVLLALTSTTTARERGLPVLGHLLLGTDCAEDTSADVITVGTQGSENLMGASGTLELASAINRIRRQGGAATVQWKDREERVALRLTVRGEPSETEVRSDRIDHVPAELAELLAVPLQWTAPQWVCQDLPPINSSYTLGSRQLLVLTDQPEWCVTPDVMAVLSRHSFRFVTPGHRPLPGAVVIDLSSEASLQESVRQLDAVTYDTILVLKNLHGMDAVGAVTDLDQLAGGILELLFAVARHSYERLERAEVSLGAVCLHAVAEDTALYPSPFTGMLSGFTGALIRELPRAVCKQINVPDGDLAQAIALLEAEFAQGPRPAPSEVCYQRGLRHVSKVVPLNEVVTGQSLLDRDSVVLATGGARGITAVLLESLLRRFGCTVVLMGRADPVALPLELRSLDEDAVAHFEPEFYRRERAKNPDVRMFELKQRFEACKAAHEVVSTLRTLQSLPGKVNYLRANVTDEQAVDAAIRQVAKDFGRLDMVIHGAGIQSSKRLPTKKLEEFRAIVATKLAGLGHLLRACRQYLPDRKFHVHLVTSTFSHLGNAGQQDYGAANVAMDRIAQHFAVSPDLCDASSLGWLGWFNVGMTKGSEYVRLAIQRRLRGITRHEGAACFDRFLSGRPLVPNMHLLTELEADYFGLSVENKSSCPGSLCQPSALEQTWTLTLETYPFLKDHMLDGVPTLPGAFALELAARTALTLRPQMQVGRLDQVSIKRFVKVRAERPVELRAAAHVVEEGEGWARIRVRLLSDFVHASGRVLQKDIVHLETEITLKSESQPVNDTRRSPVVVSTGWKIPDPYLHSQAPFRMTGFFQSLHAIQVGPAHSTAVFRMDHTPAMRAAAGSLIPFVLLDGLWRFSAMRREDDDTAVVCVPLECQEIEVLSGVNDEALVNRECFLTCSAPRIEGNYVFVEWAQAVDDAGRVMFSLKDMVGRIYGRVPAQAQAISLRRPAAESDREVDRTTRTSQPVPFSFWESSKPFQGKVALVTGSGHGLGKVIARQLADLGANVIVNSFHSRQRGEETTAAIVADGGQAVHLWGSITNPAHQKHIFEEIESRFGGLDFLVSNAGAGIFAKLDDVTPKHWERAFRTNVVALHQIALMAAALMRPRGGGTIVALSSIGSQLCFDYFGCIGPVKAALECLVRYLAIELADDNIQVNSVSAGPIDGELLDKFPGRPRWEVLVPRKQLNQDHEISEAVMFLLANSGMNGAALVVDAAARLCICEPAFVTQ